MNRLKSFIAYSKQLRKRNWLMVYTVSDYVRWRLSGCPELKLHTNVPLHDNICLMNPSGTIGPIYCQRRRSIGGAYLCAK